MHNTNFSQRAAILVLSKSHARVRHASTPGWISFKAPATRLSLPSLVRRTLQLLAVRAATGRERWRQRRNARRTIQALGQLDDYLLRDLGLDRSAIHSIAAGASGDPRERSPDWRHV